MKGLTPMHDEVRFLPTFLAVCDEGGFHRASEKLNLSQPAVSYQIRTLERLLGTPLFARAGRGVVLTERGALLRDYCRHALADFAAVRRQLLSPDLLPSRTLRIASVSAFGRYVLFPLLCEISPLPRLELRFPAQEEVLRQVRAGAVDVGFIYEGRVSSSLNATRVGSEELVLVDGATSKRRTKTLGETAAHDFVTWDEHEYVFGRWFAAAFGRQPPEVRSAAHFEEMEEVLELVRRGAGMSVVPLDCARPLLDHRKIRVVRPPRARRCVNDVFAVRRADRTSEDVQRVIDTVIARW